MPHIHPLYVCHTCIMDPHRHGHFDLFVPSSIKAKKASTRYSWKVIFLLRMKIAVLHANIFLCLFSHEIMLSTNIHQQITKKDEQARVRAKE